MADHADGWEPPLLQRKALLHGHCHHKATGGIDSEKSLLEKMGLEVEELDSGCCGMAGGWGYETGHYDVSIACGERKLLPAVRDAAPDTIVVADGFSCRSQIALARQFGPAGPSGSYPERAAASRPEPGAVRTAARAVVAAAAVAGVAGFTYSRLR
jgi:Fe-S oxidoreductase